MIKKILIPYIKRKREELYVPNKPWLLICDVLKGQWTEAVKNVVEESKGKMVSVPNNWTNYFQPLDHTVNNSSKYFLRKEAQSWYSQEIVKQQSIVAWMSRNSLLEAGAKSEGEVTATGLEPRTT